MKISSKMRPFIAAAVFLFSASLLSAQAWRISTSGLLESNGNVRTGMGLSGGFSVDTTITDLISAGVKFDVGGDFGGLVAFEPMLFGRWYFLKLGIFEFYAQGGLGTVIFNEGGRVVPAFVADASAGARISLRGIYVEPYVRSGYPAGIGIGVAAGYTFPPIAK
ncbi:MAG: hypothetical protein LBS97_01225 [Treponema sp.]|jgi:hypothetical protein|nr:hypothetical protein [Treponema sp.]